MHEARCDRQVSQNWSSEPPLRTRPQARLEAWPKVLQTGAKTGVANRSSEPPPGTRPETCAKLDLIDAFRKWELGAPPQGTRPATITSWTQLDVICRYRRRELGAATWNETRNVHEARVDRQVSQTGAMSCHQERDQKKRDLRYARSSM